MVMDLQRMPDHIGNFDGKSKPVVEASSKGDMMVFLIDFGMDMMALMMQTMRLTCFFFVPILVFIKLLGEPSAFAA